MGREMDESAGHPGRAPVSSTGAAKARATGTLLRLAPFTAAFRPRPDDIFSHGFQN